MYVVIDRKKAIPERFVVVFAKMIAVGSATLNSHLYVSLVIFPWRAGVYFNNTGIWISLATYLPMECSRSDMSALWGWALRNLTAFAFTLLEACSETAIKGIWSILLEAERPCGLNEALQLIACTNYQTRMSKTPLTFPLSVSSSMCSTIELFESNLCMLNYVSFFNLFLALVFLFCRMRVIILFDL